jgi:hypothetical protein
VQDDGLQYLHERLATHFEALQAQRDTASTAAPLFALEHGLTDAEVLLLRTRVCEAVRIGRLPRDAWLPFVVYAAEIGYQYSGDEYWQTFEAATPGWAEYGDRQYIRRHFVRFKETFRGAQPTGPWARHFSIICWPITHAVLPSDLQRHLARLLFDYRRALTSELLHDPDELGLRLAARSWHASSRFQNFAQNSELLGRVASALLLGEEDDSPYLLRPTLHRIVGDLEQQREARVWLRDAKSTASQVRARGFRLGGDSRAGLTPNVGRSEALAPSTDPVLWLRWEGGGWFAYMDFPDLSVLGERFPTIREELNRHRAIVDGASASPIASGRLLYGRQRLRLAAWPDPSRPLIQLDGGSAETNSLIADQCVLFRRGSWLFRLREAGSAAEIRGAFVRPGNEYVLLTVSPTAAQVPAWITTDQSRTAGVTALRIKVPTVLDDDALRVLRDLGLSAVTEVEIRPVGLVPALWDGEGVAEWFVGETPMLALTTTRDVARAIVAVDSNPHVVTWPEARNPLLLKIDGLAAGVHDVQVSLIGPDAAQAVSEGTFQILVRPPGPRPSGGTLREGLTIIPSPASPSLDELWDGDASLEVRGPAGVDINLHVQLMDRTHRVQARATARAKLPIEHSQWSRLFASRIRGNMALHNAYDDAEACIIKAHHPDLGLATVRVDRVFAPLRWAGRRGSDGQPRLRLINNTELDSIDIEFYEFARPDISITPGLDERAELRMPGGGLAVARVADYQAVAILPRDDRGLQGFHALHIDPQLAERRKSLREVSALLDLARKWAAGSLTVNPFGEYWRLAVLRAITADLCALIGGTRWAEIERRVARDLDDVAPREMQEAVGRDGYQAALAGVLSIQAPQWVTQTSERRVEQFATILSRYARLSLGPADRQITAEFLLRLASEPASLGAWTDSRVQPALQRTLDSPVLLRAARFAVHLIEQEASLANDEAAEEWGWA